MEVKDRRSAFGLNGAYFARAAPALRSKRWLLAGGIAILTTVSSSAAVLNITTLSTRPDRVSGGDVLVQVTQDNNASTPVSLNGADVTSAFRAGSAPNTREGLVTGLIIGTNTLSAGGVSLQIHNYPITGPITSGPHNTPFICQTQNFVLPDGTT